jgi:hypothetical protein
VVVCVPSVHKVLGLMPSTDEKKERVTLHRDISIMKALAFIDRVWQKVRYGHLCPPFLE